MLRLAAIHDALVRCDTEKVPGDYVEVGSLRAGSSVFAAGMYACVRACIRACVLVGIPVSHTQRAFESAYLRIRRMRMMLRACIDLSAGIRHETPTRP